MQKIIIFVLLFLIFNFQTIKAKNNFFFLMLKNEKVNVRYGPSFDYPIKFVYKKFQLPLKIIDKKENFRRIIDHKNNSGWIHISQLRKAKSLIALENKILSLFGRPELVPIKIFSPINSSLFIFSLKFSKL